MEVQFFLQLSYIKPPLVLQPELVSSVMEIDTHRFTHTNSSCQPKTERAELPLINSFLIYILQTWVWTKRSNRMFLSKVLFLAQHAPLVTVSSQILSNACFGWFSSPTSALPHAHIASILCNLSKTILYLTGCCDLIMLVLVFLDHPGGWSRVSCRSHTSE